MTRPSVPVSWFALALLAALIGLVGWIALSVRFEIEALERDARAKQAVNARDEISRVLADVLRMAQDNGRRLAEWDETRVQFFDPQYYLYWRESRVRGSNVVDPSVSAIELYDKQGRILGAPEIDHPMPARLTSLKPSLYVIHESGRTRLFTFRPVFADESQQALLGYVGLQFDLIRELRRIRGLRHVEAESLATDLAAGARIPTDQILPHLRYRLVGLPELDDLRSILWRSMLRLGIAVAFIAVVAYLLTRVFVVKPLRSLADHIRTLRTPSREVATHNPGLISVRELEEVRKAIGDYESKLSDAHQNLEQKNVELWALAHKDPLTGAHNRRAFEDDLQELLADESPGPVSFMLFDCDHFKAINDSYGHEVGDQVLRGIVESLRAALRSDDRLYRLGGDEFATIVRDVSVERTQHIAERCLAEMTAHDFRSLEVKEPVTLSIGVAHADVAEDCDDLPRRADIAMYTAKRPGANKIALYSPLAENRQPLVGHREVSAVVRAVSDPSLLEMHYQPVVTLPDRRPSYSESLVRIRHEAELVPPSRIFPVVENRRLEAEFDLAVVAAIANDIDAGLLPPDQGISINVSGPGLIHREVLTALARLADRAGGRKLVLEVTETTLITQLAETSHHLSALREAGFLVALDDFGSGYSSLRYLSGMPVDLVKFDITMIRSLESPSRQARIVADLARLIQDVGYSLVAEGVESEHTVSRLISLGFSAAQGYLFGRPERPVLLAA